MPRHLKEFLLALLVGGFFGGSLAWSLEELTWLKLSKSQFLVALVYGPLLSFGELSRPVAWKAGCDAIAFAVVWQAMRDRRWSPLATVVTATILFGALAGFNDARLVQTFLRYTQSGRAIDLYDVENFSRHSPEGFVFLTLGASAWYALLIGCVAYGWTRQNRLAPSRGGEFSGVLEAAAPFVGGAAFGFTCGTILDATSNWIYDPYHPIKCSDTLLQLIVAGQSAIPKVGMGSPRYLLAGLFACQTLLLWRAADGTRRRRAAAASYFFLLAAQVVGSVRVILPVGPERFFASEWRSLHRIFNSMPEQMIFLGAALAAWHAMAIWCLFRYRPARSDVAPTSPS